MRQVEIRQPGPPESLVVVEGPISRPKEGEVLIAVRAAGINRPDLLQRQGAYPPPPGASPLPGLEISGEVAEVGPGVAEWRSGDPVCALLAGGGYAEYAVAPAPQCLPIPFGLDWTEAAALPETFFTVWANVFQTGHLQRGEAFLVHGGTSGIGTTAVQLARAFGARVFATAGSAQKCAACLRLGADAAINYRISDFVSEVERLTGNEGVDVILDMVGGEYTERNIRVLAPRGRLLQIAFMGGSRVNLDLRPVLTKRLVITGSALRPRTVEEKGAIAQELLAEVWPLLAKGVVKPIIDRTFPLHAAAEAHRYLEAGEHIGKIVLTV